MATVKRARSTSPPTPASRSSPQPASGVAGATTPRMLALTTAPAAVSLAGPSPHRTPVPRTPEYDVASAQTTGASALTIRDGAHVITSMVRGEKNTLDWRRKLHLGWYYLHVGTPSHGDASRQAPPPEAPSSVFLGRVRLHEGFKPDADETLHQHTVLESVEFDESIPWKGGASGAWRLERRPPLHGLLLSAGGRHRCFHSPESPRPETSPHATRGRSSITTPWVVRAVPRKRRVHTSTVARAPRHQMPRWTPLARRTPDRVSACGAARFDGTRKASETNKKR